MSVVCGPYSSDSAVVDLIDLLLDLLDANEHEAHRQRQRDKQRANEGVAKAGQSRGAHGVQLPCEIANAMP